MATKPSQARRIADRKAKGLCIDCGFKAMLKPNGGTANRCAGCSDKISNARARRIAKGLCSVCGEVPRRAFKATCGPCAKRQYANHKNFLAKRRACNSTEPVIALNMFDGSPREGI